MLHSDWVDRIFEKLTLRYGVKFMRQWENMDANAVKGDWAIQLKGYSLHPEQIKFALDNLPERMIENVEQFRSLCRQAPKAEAKDDGKYSIDPEKMRDAMQKLDSLTKKKHNKYRGWIKPILDNPKNYPDCSIGLAKAAALITEDV
jgi:hypothetical protein